jgi:hypothetical protein
MQHWARLFIEDLLWKSGDVSELTRQGAMRILKVIEDREHHLFRTDDLERIADDISECSDLEELAELMWTATTTLHFQNFAIFVLRQGQGRSFNPRICTSFNEGWIERYVEQSYQFVDPVMVRASQADGWFTFSELDESSPILAAFWLDAARFGVGRNGICFAMTRKDGTRIGISFSSSDTKEKINNIVKINFIDMHFIAALASDAFCYSASGPSLPDETLTISELRFLHALVTSKNPEEALEVYPVFGSNQALQSSIRRKLGVNTVFQAVAVAASKGWFDLLPYEHEQIAKPFRPLLGMQEALGPGFSETPD